MIDQTPASTSCVLMLCGLDFGSLIENIRVVETVNQFGKLINASITLTHTSMMPKGTFRGSGFIFNL